MHILSFFLKYMIFFFTYKRRGKGDIYIYIFIYIWHFTQHAKWLQGPKIDPRQYKYFPPNTTACNCFQKTEILSVAFSCFNLMEDNKDTAVLTAVFTDYLQLRNVTPLAIHTAVSNTVCAATWLMLDLPGIFLLHFPITFVLRLLISSFC
jgi:hypothetical protein